MTRVMQQKVFTHIGNNLTILPWKVGIGLGLSNLEVGYCRTAQREGGNAVASCGA